MLYPMFALVLLTSLVAFYLFGLRFKAVKSKQIRLSQFRLNNAGDVPEAITQAARNYTNLFEIPVLFYAAGILALVLNLQSQTMVVCAWGFVISRVLHSWIHVTYNNVLHRLYAFMLGVLLVLAMWVLLALGYSYHP
jgi:hypothetical protein